MEQVAATEVEMTAMTVLVAGLVAARAAEPVATTEVEMTAMTARAAKATTALVGASVVESGIAEASVGSIPTRSHCPRVRAPAR